MNGAPDSNLPRLVARMAVLRILVQGMMLWPEDQSARERLCKAEAIRLAASRGDRLPVTIARRVFALTAEAPPIAELRKNADDRHAHGWIAGEILRRAVDQAGREGDNVNLREIIGQIVKAYAPYRSAGKVHLTPSVKTIVNTIWPRYRPVAHFWAAFLGRIENGAGRAFPCSLDELPAFLKSARRYLGAGQEARTKQGPVLRPGESVGIPEI